MAAKIYEAVVNSLTKTKSLRLTEALAFVLCEESSGFTFLKQCNQCE